MPFLIEAQLKAGWSPVGWEDTEDLAAAVLRAGAWRKPDIKLRATEMDEARINHRFAKHAADHLLREYIAANARAYDLKLKIKPRHKPQGWF